MSFYEEIASYYDFIFPMNAAQVDFTKNCLTGGMEQRKILDIGCGTGDLAIALSSIGFEVTGIDADAAMLDKARAKTGNRMSPTFITMDMRNIAQSFAASTFEAVLCFGNTLVHLSSPSEISLFCKSVKTVLKKKGKFLLQILNYDHVLDHNVRALPLIENDILLFERFYEYDREKNLLRFKTTLTIKAENIRIVNDIPLYPLRQQELDKMLIEAGFVNISYYGDFDRRPLGNHNLPLIVEAS